MTLGLKKYAEQLTHAWNSVLDDKDDTDWSLFGYDGQSNDLKVISTGKYGLEELSQEFNPGKVLYAFCKVTNPKSNLPCFITINWVGGGAPFNRKSNSPNHSIELQKFLKYSSLTIQAREDEEVEPDAILDKIRKSSTTEFNFKIKSTDIDDKPSPVSTNFERIRPEKDLNLKEKTNFWSKLEKEEKEIKQQEVKKLKEQKLNERNLISNRMANNPLKNQIIKNETSDVINKVDKLNLKSEIVNEREKFWKQQEAEERRQRDEENRRRFQEKKAIENEIRNFENSAKLIMNNFNNPSNTNSQVHKKINAIDEINLEKKKVLSSIKNSINNKENNEVNIQTDDDSLNDELVIHEEDESLSEKDSTFIKHIDNQENDDDGELNRTYTKQINDFQENDYYKLQAEYCVNQQQQPYLISQRINEEDEIYDDEEYENEYCLDNANYASYMSKRLSNEPLEDIAEEDEDLLQEEDEENLEELIKGKGECVRALFDYEASDDTEITFNFNDIITHVEKKFDTWWYGRTKDEKYGMFPANYVTPIPQSLPENM